MMMHSIYEINVFYINNRERKEPVHMEQERKQYRYCKPGYKEPDCTAGYNKYRWDKELAGIVPDTVGLSVPKYNLLKKYLLLLMNTNRIMIMLIFS